MVTSNVFVEPYQFSSHTSAISRPRETTLSRLAARMFSTSNSLPVSEISSDPAPGDVDPESFRVHGRLRLVAGNAGGGGTPQQRPDPRLQLGQAERLREV